ncbi:hypothetical protein ACIA6D_32680 [Streptomyces cacaoi]
MKKLGRIAALASVLVSCSLTSVAAGATEATAASCYSSYNINYLGAKAGQLDWNADPSSCYANGDAFRVCDTAADTWGVFVSTNDAGIRYATTQGHSSPYCSPWVTGNITEGKKITFSAYVVKGSDEVYIGDLTVTA